jgi:hypothetical protein
MGLQKGGCLHFLDVCIFSFICTAVFNIKLEKKILETVIDIPIFYLTTS